MLMSKMKYKMIVPLIFTLGLSFREVCGYKILGLFPYAGRSHFIMFKKIMEELALKGHTVHVLSHHPRDSPLTKYTDLSVRGSVPLPNNYVSFEGFKKPEYDIFNIGAMIRYEIFDMGAMVSHYRIIEEHADVMKSWAVQKLLKSNERYDLIITESFLVDMTLGFAHKFKTPVIFLSSSNPYPWTNDFMANPQNPAIIPHLFSRLSSSMTFIERFKNTFGMIIHLVAWYKFYLPLNQQIASEYFGDAMPPLLNILKNASLFLTNLHPTIVGGRPSAPNLIDIGGIHIEPAKTLPYDIEKFIEESPHGVVYFCMGSMFRTATLPQEQQNAFFYTFSKLKERVLWKFEDESITVPDNVMIKAWMPQRDILAHPKVKLFISHGGLLGILEAVSEAKPIVGIPMFGDQGMNIRSLELQGTAKYVEYLDINNDTIYEAVREMLHPKYAERAKELSKLFHDRPLSPIDTAVYWIEYVIRNKGARHLRSPAVDLPFYQYLLLDVILFFIFSVITSIFFIYFSIKMLRKFKNLNLKRKLKIQ